MVHKRKASFGRTKCLPLWPIYIGERRKALGEKGGSIRNMLENTLGM